MFPAIKRSCRTLTTWMILNSFLPISSFGQTSAHAFLIASPNPNELLIDRLPKLKGENVSFPNLKSEIEIDLGRMEKWLIGSGFTKSQITIIDGDDLSINKIKANILLITPNLAKDALVLFYFTGHGVQLYDKKNVTDIEPDGLDEGLVLNSEVWIDDDIYAFYVSNMREYRNVMIIDACYSGTTYKVWGEPTIRELLLAGSSKGLYDELITQYTEDSCAPFLVDKNETKFAMLYFGAAGDTQQAKADNDGSWLTKSISLIVKDSDFIKDGNYRILHCALRNMAMDQTLNFNPEYIEIGNVQSYNLTKPLK